MGGGFKDYSEFKTAQSSGFQTRTDYVKAKELGFTNGDEFRSYQVELAAKEKEEKRIKEEKEKQEQIIAKEKEQEFIAKKREEILREGESNIDFYRFDHFYLYKVKKTVALALLYKLSGGTQADHDFMIVGEVGYDMKASELIGKHPDWSAEDIYTEVKNTPLFGNNADKDHIYYLYKNNITQSEVKNE